MLPCWSEVFQFHQPYSLEPPATGHPAPPPWIEAGEDYPTIRIDKSNFFSCQMTVREVLRLTEKSDLTSVARRQCGAARRVQG
jgi:hypothetical protein